MSDDKTKKPDLALPTPAYEVGYKRPPERGRFKPGRSGNPKGRPKGAKNKRPALHDERLKSIVLDEAYRDISVHDGTRNVTIPMAQAVVRAMAVKAAKGDHKSQRLFAELLSTTERQNKALHDEFLDTAMTYKIEWESELARREKLGIDGPEPLPHPDHVKINMRTGDVRILGPSTKEEKAEYDWFMDRKRAFEEELGELKEDLERENKPRVRDIIQTEIERTERVLEIIRESLPEEPRQRRSNLRFGP